MNKTVTQSLLAMPEPYTGEQQFMMKLRQILATQMGSQLDRFLHTVLGRTKETATLRWMKPDSKLLLAAHPLTHHAFGDFQGLGDFFLFPALLVQLPGTQSSAFAPIFRKEFFLAHTSFDRLAKFITLDPHAEVNNRNGIRGWYNRAAGGVSFLLIKTQTPQEATALLQPSRGPMRCAVRAAPTLDDEQQIQPLRHVSQQTGSSTGCPATRGDPVGLNPGSLALGGDCLACSGAPCSTSKLLCPRLSTPVREEKSYA